MTSRTDHALTRARDLATVVRRAVLRRRRLLAVLFTVAAVASGLRVAAPPAPDTVDVLVADRSLAAGTVLSPADLRRVAFLPDALPRDLLDDPAGATLAAPVGAGEPITATRVMGPGLATDLPGVTAVPVRLSDPAQAALLRVGVHIDVLATDPQAGTTETVAVDVPVLGLPTHDDTGTGSALTGRVVVLGVPDALVGAVTSATVATYVTFAWSSV